MTYRIIPLALSKYIGEKGYMTFLTDYGVPIIRPFIMWYIEGLEKNVIVDTGIEAEDYKKYHPEFRNLDIEPLMTFEEALESVNLKPEKVDIIIQTHLHFDHCYNTRKCKNAKVLVQKNELEFAKNPVPFEGIYRKDLYEGLDFEIINGDRNLLEGIELLFVPGHTAGGQAVCIETDKGKAVISGLCTIKENFYPDRVHPMAGGGTTILPGIMLDPVKAFISITRIKKLGKIILPLHEPGILEIKSIP